jgi:chemotaxis protein histidine kinase CheA
VEPEFADLIPLFVGEVHGRLERLTELTDRVEHDTGAAAEARRELHTLKGAGRMLRLSVFAELCHAAEAILQNPRPDAAALLTRVTDRLAAIVDAVAQGRDPEADPALMAALAGDPPVAAALPAQTRTPAAEAPHATAVAPASSEVRIDAAKVEALAEGATRLRILTHGANRLVTRLHELAHLADVSLREAHPQQALAALAVALRGIEAEADATQMRLQRAAEQQQEALLGLQVQPLQGLLMALARHARELAQTLGREVEVGLSGGETRLDRRITRDLEEALVHIVRNAVDHGLETPEARVALGKPRTGTLKIAAVATGGRVRLTITDDGAGIDPAKVVEAAVKAGHLDRSRASALGRDEALRLLFLPGLSTREEITEVSGRGIGLDAVAAAVTRAGGFVTIDSHPGRSTSVVVEVPAARRGEEVVVVRAGTVRLALPASAVARVDRLRRDDVVERDGRTLASLGGRLVPFASLARLLGEEPAPVQLLLQGVHAGVPLAVAVDVVERSEEVLLWPGGRALAGNPLLEGIALLASGEPVGVLSPQVLAQGGNGRRVAVATPATRARRLRVLLVDDSLVTREMERRLLEDAGFDVTTAADGQEGIAVLGEERFDCLVTDVEMPGLDGYALTRHVRAVPALAQLPVVVVSTHNRPEERLKGLEAGADAYLTKQSLNATELVGLVRRLAGA